MTTPTETKRRAADTILLAALDCGLGEFTEWDLTIAAWKLDPQTFGMRGHLEHPDHKRVYMEITGRRPQNPIYADLMERVRANTYRLTPLGIATVDGLKNGESNVLYNLVDLHLSWPIFRRWLNDPDEPRSIKPGFDLAKVERDTRAAMKWCDDHDLAVLPSRFGPAINYNRLAELLDFLAVLRMRFPKETRAA